MEKRDEYPTAQTVQATEVQFPHGQPNQVSAPYDTAVQGLQSLYYQPQLPLGPPQQNQYPYMYNQPPYGYLPYGYPPYGYPPYGPLPQGPPAQGPPAHGPPPHEPTPHGTPPHDAQPQGQTTHYHPPYAPTMSTIPNFNPAPEVVHKETSNASAGNANTAQSPAEDVPTAIAKQRNNPQTWSAGSASFIIITGGMNIAWSCGFGTVEGFRKDTHILICWYIAAIIGAFIAALFTNVLIKKSIYIFSSFLVVSSGILFLALPHEYIAILASRYINGFAVGMVFVPMMVLIGEEVVSSERGKAASLLEMSNFALGIFVQMAITTIYTYTHTHHHRYYTFGPTHLHGAFVIAFGAITLITSCFLVIESPIYYLKRGDETEAIDCLRRLQRPYLITQETYQQLEEHKRYLANNASSSSLGLLALVKLCIYRGLISLSFSSYVATALNFAIAADSGGHSHMPFKWQYMTFGLTLWLGTFIAAFMLDWAGRKTLMLIGALICGCIAIGVGLIYNDTLNLYFISKFRAILYMLFVLPAFAGFFSISSSAYLTEAFPLQLKPCYIGISFIVQMSVLLIIGTLNQKCPGEYFITFGALYLAAFVAGILFMPETKKLALREAQVNFRTAENVDTSNSI